MSASNWGPVLKLLGTVLGILAGIALLTLVVMVLLESVFNVDTPLPPDGIVAKVAKLFKKDDLLIATPTPYYTPEPTATPHPMEAYNAGEAEKEVVLSVDTPYRWFGDPYVYNGVMLFTAGKIVDGDVHMCALIKYDPQTGDYEEMPIQPKNAHFIYAVFNDEWLVYLDANYDGGGTICAYSLTDDNALPIEIKKVYVGQPELRLYDHYIVWIERTGTSRDKLYVCDIETQESTTVSTSCYGSSAPFIYNGILIWAADDSTYIEDDRTISTIKYISLDTSAIHEYKTGTYVHDPEMNGNYVVWLDAHHSATSKLYVAPLDGSTSLNSSVIATGVVDFYLDEKFVAYSIDEVVYVYMFDTGKSYRITPEWESAQLLGASGGYVIWMDVTTRECDVLKFANIPT